MDDLPTPVRHTAHGNLPDSCRISSPSPEAMNFVKDNYKMRRVTFKFLDLVHFILEVLQVVYDISGVCIVAADDVMGAPGPVSLIFPLAIIIL